MILKNAMMNLLFWKLLVERIHSLTDTRHHFWIDIALMTPSPQDDVSPNI